MYIYLNQWIMYHMRNAKNKIVLTWNKMEIYVSLESYHVWYYFQIQHNLQFLFSDLTFQ